VICREHGEQAIVALAANGMEDTFPLTEEAAVARCALMAEKGDVTLANFDPLIILLCLVKHLLDEVYGVVPVVIRLDEGGVGCMLCGAELLHDLQCDNPDCDEMLWINTLIPDCATAVAMRWDVLRAQEAAA
jgi:hypothetical protein